MILALLATASMPMMRVDPAERVLSVSEPASVTSLFKQACFDPFPDGGRTASAVAARGDLTAWQPETPLEAQVQAQLPSRIWLSPSATVRYIARDHAVADMPDPQCSVMAVVAGADATPLFSPFAGALGLQGGKVVGKTRYRTSMWDIARPDGQHWRVIFGSRSESDGLHLTLSMLNLVPEKR